jgi:hypothetical protein
MDMRHFAAAFFGFCVLSNPSAALCEDSSFISMRAPSDAAPQYCCASRTASGDQSSTTQGCDGTTYCVTEDDFDVVSEALSDGNTVQLDDAPEDVSPEDAPIICVMQAA